MAFCSTQFGGLLVRNDRNITKSYSVLNLQWKSAAIQVSLIMNRRKSRAKRLLELSDFHQRDEFTTHCQ